MIRVLLSIILLFMPLVADACIPVPLSDEERAARLENVYYLGLVKTIDRQEITPKKWSENKDLYGLIMQPSYILTLKLYKDYRHPEKKFPETIEVFGRGNSCSHYIKVVGKTYETVIFENNGAFEFYERGGTFFTRDEFSKMREIAGGLPEEIKEKEKQCLAGGGVWFGPTDEGTGSHFVCRMPASDAGKPCENSAGCEGACLAKVTNKEKYSLAPQDVRKEEIKFSDLVTPEAYCSEWLYLEGCHVVREQWPANEDVVRKRCNRLK